MRLHEMLFSDSTYVGSVWKLRSTVIAECKENQFNIVQSNCQLALAHAVGGIAVDSQIGV